MTIPWGTITNLEQSFQKFIKAQLITDGLTEVDTVVAEQLDDTWTLPIIQIYVDSQTSPRLEIGSNLRMDSYLVIMEVRGRDVMELKNIVSWLRTAIENGLDYYTYANNPVNPDAPTETLTGRIGVDFLTNQRVIINENLSLIDKYRQRISLNCWF